ncbi:hypothetical protein ACWC5I_18530 [Kitasatospora sp. NPDC001574]
MTGWQRALWWGLGVVGVGAMTGTVWWLTATHPGGAGQVWGAVSAVAGVAAVVVALWQLRAASSSTRREEPMTGSDGAIVAGGDVSDSTTSASGPAPASVTGPGPVAGTHGTTGAIVARGKVKNSHTEYRP